MSSPKAIKGRAVVRKEENALETTENPCGSSARNKELPLGIGKGCFMSYDLFAFHPKRPLLFACGVRVSTCPKRTNTIGFVALYLSKVHKPDRFSRYPNFNFLYKCLIAIFFQNATLSCFEMDSLLSARCVTLGMKKKYPVWGIRDAKLGLSDKIVLSLALN
ncbi:MAG: hypothetical protein KIPDCIKN_02424 [Haliscomenobacter sp.]|nr:hypothetical protein [Haliscomenobacter sp.]